MLSGATGVSLTGFSGHGTSSNSGLTLNRVMIKRSSVRSTNALGVYMISGNSGGLTSGSINGGLKLVGSTFDSAREIRFDANVSGGSVNNNYGASFSRVTASAVISIRVDAEVDNSTTGKANYGVLMNRSDFSAGTDIFVEGVAGSGTSNNQGVRISGGSLIAGGNLMIDGTGERSTTGKGNIGVAIINGVSLAGTLGISSAGGGGIGMNHGIFMNRRIEAETHVGASIVGFAGGGADSEDLAGDFFPLP
jgi:hypothetical protein